MSIENDFDWDDTTANYVELFEPLTGHFATLAADRVGIEEKPSAIDLACGPGAAATRLLRRGVRVTAIDFSEGMIGVLRKREHAALAAGELETHCRDGQSLPFADGAFDIAVSAFGVVLFADYGAGLRELRRVTKSGGETVITSWPTPDHSGFMVRWRDAIRDHVPTFEYPAASAGLTATETPPLFASVLEDAGYKQVSVSVEPFDWLIHNADWFCEHFSQNPFPRAIHAGLAEQTGDETIGSVIRDSLHRRLRDEFGTESFTLKTSALIARAIA